MALNIERLGRVALAFHDNVNPSDSEWGAWVAMCSSVAKDDPARAVCVVRTLGGAPSAKQRSALAKAIEACRMPTAVMTDSGIGRGVVTAISWLGVPVRAFRPDARNGLRDYLKLDPDELSQVSAALNRISKSVA